MTRALAGGALALAATTALKLAFADAIGGPTPFLLYFASIMLAAWEGGLFAGLATTAAAALLGRLFFMSPGAAREVETALQLAVFMLEGVAISLVTTRMRSAERMARLAASEASVGKEWFSTALRSIGDAVVATDRDGTVTFMNPVAAELTGWTTAEGAGKPLREVFPIFDERTRDVVESPVERVIREGLIVGMANHTVLRRRDGSEIAIDDSAAPIRDSRGELVGVVMVFRDVAEKRREDDRRALLVKASAELGSSLDYPTTMATLARLATPEIADWAAVDVVEDGKVQRLAVAHVDPAKLELVAELQRRCPSDPADPAATRGVPAILRSGKPEMIADIAPELLEAAGRDPEHLALIRTLSLRSYIGVPLNARGKTIGVITFVMAESNRLYAEQDLAFAMALADRAAAAIDNARLFREIEAARAEAEVANRSKDEFLAMLGHELRNPLAPILTALQLMKLREGGTLERERVVIERQVDHVVRLVDDLLDVSRITRGQIALHREPVEMAEVVAAALEMSSPLIEERRHEVSVSVPLGLLVDGDRTRLAQVVGNLLNNAAKYMEQGGHIRIDAERAEGSVVLRVRDDGMGIAPEMLPRVFDLFAQEPQALDRAQGGLGLGLAIVRSLALLHDGEVTAQSDGVGKGSEIRVRLPALDPASELEPPAASVPAAARITEAGAIRVLVVDDNEDAAELLSEALRMHGLQVFSANDGPSALMVAQEARPHVAVLDIGLPVMDGYELASRLRGTIGLEDIKLVALTGYGQSSDRERSRRAGFDAHLVKPVNVAQVRTTIQELTIAS